ncbi:MAG: DUF945 family protein [Woeseiaceae bacterium]|nr:DUF945 family protein [Woeseiaceae bacterium]
MNKGVVAILVILALIVLITPGIVGRMAEKSVEQNLERADSETPEISVTSQKFDRGWFSSEGQHRVEIKDPDMRAEVIDAIGDHYDGELPAVVIDTHLDHGIIPVSSMSREKGSLAPGLGSAISTLSLEMPDGEIVRIPGTIYSSIGLTGNMDNNLVLEAGSFGSAGTTASWGATDITVTSSPSNSVVGFDGVIESIRVNSAEDDVEFSGLSFSGNQRPTRYGIATGDMKLEIQSISATPAAGPAVSFGPFVVDGRTDLVDDRIDLETKASFAGLQAPGMGEIGVDLDFAITDVDPAAMAAVADALDQLGPEDEDPQVMLAAAEEPLKDLLASGMQFDLRQLDIALPQGKIATRLSATVQETDRDNFAWSSLMLATEGSADVSIPKEVMDFVIAMNPQAGMAVGMGFLRLNGDIYELEAEYKKGLLTVNGAPMPVPLPGR